MAVKTGGVYLAFDGGPDGSSAGDPGIGPYDEIVLRGARAVGERAGLGKVIALRSAAGSWRDAESSSAESDGLGGGRGNLRVSAADDEVLVRFSADEVAGHTGVPELGPFAVVIIGTHDIRGDEDILAVRVSRISPWQLTDRAGASFQGALKEALAFVAAGRSAAIRPREPSVTAELPPSGREAPAAAAPADDQAPSVWVDRVRAAPEIYVSRPDRKR